MVRIAWADKRQQLVTEAEAVALCSNRKVSGSIIDAVTIKKELQTKLRALMDE